MSRLAAKGILTRRKEGRAYLYRATVQRKEAAFSSVRDWAQRFFGGRVLPAVTFLLGSESLTPEDVAQLKQIVDRLAQPDETEPAP